MEAAWANQFASNGNTSKSPGRGSDTFQRSLWLDAKLSHRNLPQCSVLEQAQDFGGLVHLDLLACCRWRPHKAPNRKDDMRPTLLLLPTLAVALLAGERSACAQQYYGPPPFAYGQHQAEEAWEHQGFNDGMIGAEKDFGNHRRPDVNNRWEYRDPDVPGWALHEYREGFRRGYYLRVRQIYYVGRRDDD
jgi:hypothetical protein